MVCLILEAPESLLKISNGRLVSRSFKNIPEYLW